MKFKLSQALVFALLLFCGSARAQEPPPVQIEEEYVQQATPEQQAEQLKVIYDKKPDSVYSDYFKILLSLKRYKDAHKLVDEQIKTHPDDPFLHVDKGRIYADEKEEDKAKKQFNLLLDRVNGDVLFTERIAKIFTDAGRDDYVIQTYEKTVRILNNIYNFGPPLARLYAKSGRIEDAVEALLAGNPGQYGFIDNTKAIFLEIIGNDADKLQRAQKVLFKKINEQPDNGFYPDMLTWIYKQKNDWDGALVQIEALDERNKENGRRMLAFAGEATRAKQYEVAEKTYDEVIALGPNAPFYPLARAEKLSTALTRLREMPMWTDSNVTTLVKGYDTFLVEFPKYNIGKTASEFASLLAEYANDVPRAIAVLERGINAPEISRTTMAQFKLQMGDYYLLMGRQWDASLTYSQVDKEFKQDAMGEDARFRNARISYYRGDFEWAQKQLSILKAATSDLIANDALNLSVQITENVEDSNYVPLARFAHAGLLLFQHKYKETETLLDSLSKAFPKHPLNDDIVMLRADIAVARKDFPKALDYLKTVTEQFGKDVLADDALFKTAEIYRNDLHKNVEAKQFYEKLIIDFPGSTFAQQCRQILTEMNMPTTP